MIDVEKSAVEIVYAHLDYDSIEYTTIIEADGVDTPEIAEKVDARVRELLSEIRSEFEDNYLQG